MRARFASVLSAAILASCANTPPDVPQASRPEAADRMEFTGSTSPTSRSIAPPTLTLAHGPSDMATGNGREHPPVDLAAMPYPSRDAANAAFDFSEGIVKNPDGTFSLAPPATIPIIDVTATNVALMTGRYDKHIQAMDVDVPW